ncbi:MAG: transposase, partial [Prevotella sp.]|nr:transposase [Prevotella sp.]
DGPRQILGQVYDSIGFNCIKDEVLRHLVITRICQPSSKVATVEYLKFHHNGLTREHNIACFYHTIDKIGLTA